MSQLRHLLSSESKLTIAEKRDLLNKQSDPISNTMLWRLLEPRVIFDLGLHRDEVSQARLVRNCTGLQLDTLVSYLKPELQSELQSKRQ